MTREENVPAPQSTQAKDTWVPSSHENSKRSEGAESKKGKGAPSSHRMIPHPPGGIPACQQSLASKLRSSKEFQDIYAHGIAVRGDLVVLIFRSRSEGMMRTAVVASRKVGSAVQRNRAKRLMREGFRLCRTQGLGADFLGAGVDLVIIARKGCDRVGAHGVAAELGKLMDQARQLVSVQSPKPVPWAAVGLQERGKQ